MTEHYLPFFLPPCADLSSSENDFFTASFLHALISSANRTLSQTGGRDRSLDGWGQYRTSFPLKKRGKVGVSITLALSWMGWLMKPSFPSEGAATAAAAVWAERNGCCAHEYNIAYIWVKEMNNGAIQFIPFPRDLSPFQRQFMNSIVERHFLRLFAIWVVFSSNRQWEITRGTAEISERGYGGTIKAGWFSFISQWEERRSPGK